MLSQPTFYSYLPLSSDRLPLTIISLEDWALINISGPDAIKYLQGQLTCNIMTLTTDRFSLCAHCNSKGKVFSCQYVLYHKEKIVLIERRSIRNMHVTHLKKYAVFYNTTIDADDSVILLGVAGCQARKMLGKIFKSLPDMRRLVTHNQDTTIMFFKLPRIRFLLITTVEVYNEILSQFNGIAQFNNCQQWLALDIEAGYPIIDCANSMKFIPQAINIQHLGGIDFNKGCYLGQEIVARIKYRGNNKQAMYWLAGKMRCSPSIGSRLEIKSDSDWSQAGTVLASCKLNCNEFWVQAVLANNVNIDSLIRIATDNTSTLAVRSLPYTIT